MKKTVSFSKNATNLFFHILTRCNLKCRHCYINSAQHGKEDLPLHVIESWLKAFADKSGDANVIFLGGEPTLHKDLPAAVKLARKIGYNSITIDTNGYLFHDTLGRISPGDLDYLSFSLDGASPATNDSIRGRGSYETCTANIRKAVESGFNVSVIFTVSLANIDDLPLMGPLLKELGVERFFIQVIGIRGKSAGKSIENENNGPQVSKKRWIESVPPVARQIASLGIKVTYPKVFLDKEEAFECAGLVAQNYFIFPNKRVYRCPICEDFPLHSLEFSEGNQLIKRPRINEMDLFSLNIPEGCLMNRLIQPHNINYLKDGKPEYRIACCMLKTTIQP